MARQVRSNFVGESKFSDQLHSAVLALACLRRYLNIAHKVRIHNITTHSVLISSTLVCILYKESVTSVNILQSTRPRNNSQREFD